MSRNVVIAISALGIITMLIIYAVTQYVGAVRTGAQLDNLVEAAWENNENIYATHRRKLEQALSVSKLNASQVESIIDAAMTARYGDEGSQATFQWIQENHPQLDQSINRQLMSIMEAGENEFRNAQTRLVDIRREYSVLISLSYPLGKGWWLEMAGYPKINLDDYTIVTSTVAQETFQARIADPIEFE